MSKSKSSKKARGNSAAVDIGGSAVSTPFENSLRGLNTPALLRRLLMSDMESGTETHHSRSGYWGLPSRGGYSGGCAAGTAAATAYLKFLRMTPTVNQQYGGFLQGIAMDMLSGRSTELGSTDSESLRGQAVGFFFMIESVLCECAHLLTGLDAENFEALHRKMDSVLGRTESENDAEARQYASQRRKAQGTSKAA